MERKDVKLDELKMYFREPCIIDLKDTDGTIELLQPEIGQIVKIGQEKFYSTLSIFVTNTTNYRTFLWDYGIDWNEISDYDLFCMLYKSADQDVCDMLIKDFVIDDFELYGKTLGEEMTEVVL